MLSTYLANTNDIDLFSGHGMCPCRYGGIGGVSEFLGWTEVQREYGQGKFGGFEGVLKIFGVLLAADLLLFAYEQVNYWVSTGAGPFGN